MKRIFLYILVAAIASCSAFIIHVLTVEWLPNWISQQMSGKKITPSWDVRYVAALTSIEYGLGAVLLYLAARQTLIRYMVFYRAVFLSVCLAMVSGAFIRQPLMDVVVGNPFHVAVVQNLFKWLVWMLLGFVVVYGVEAINKALKQGHSKAVL